MGMAGLLLAAAKTGATLAEVYQWVQRRGHERALEVLAEHGNLELYAVARSLIEENRTAAPRPVDHRPGAEVGSDPAARRCRHRCGTFNAARVRARRRDRCT